MSAASLGNAQLPLIGQSPDRLLEWAPEQWHVDASWSAVVDEFFSSPAGQRLGEFVRRRLADGATIYPPQPLRALELTPLTSVHAVILGQDPYHGPGQAEGLAFSVRPGVKIPPSLSNIFKESRKSAAESLPQSGSLTGWAKRGVLLLNTSLTVEDAAPASHAKQGWEELTSAILGAVAATASPCVYLLWGAHAQAKAGLIETAAKQNGREALILRANHPSPLSARRPPVPFVGSGHFTVARKWFAERGYPDVL